MRRLIVIFFLSASLLRAQSVSDCDLRIESSFIRGDANGSGVVDISDGQSIIDYLTGGPSTPTSCDASDANDDQQIDLSDATWVFSYLTLGGPPPLPPFPDYGHDPSPDGLDPCASVPEGVPPCGTGWCWNLPILPESSVTRRICNDPSLPVTEWSDPEATDFFTYNQATERYGVTIDLANKEQCPDEQLPNGHLDSCNIADVYFLIDDQHGFTYAKIAGGALAIRLLADAYSKFTLDAPCLDHDGDCLSGDAEVVYDAGTATVEIEIGPATSTSSAERTKITTGLFPPTIYTLSYSQGGDPCVVTNNGTGQELTGVDLIYQQVGAVDMDTTPGADPSIDPPLAQAMADYYAGLGVGIDECEDWRIFEIRILDSIGYWRKLTNSPDLQWKEGVEIRYEIDPWYEYQN